MKHEGLEEGSSFKVCSFNASNHCRAPKFLVDPLEGSKYAAMQKRLELGARSRLLALERGERGVL